MKTLNFTGLQPQSVSKVIQKIYVHIHLASEKAESWAQNKWLTNAVDGRPNVLSVPHDEH